MFFASLLAFFVFIFLLSTITVAIAWMTYLKRQAEESDAASGTGAVDGTGDVAAGEESPLFRSDRLSSLSFWDSLLAQFDFIEILKTRLMQAELGWSVGRVTLLMLLSGMVAFLLRAALTGLALWIVTLVVSGIDFVGGDTTLQRIGIILVVAVIFGFVNAIIKPIVQFISIPLYILTLGLFHVVINALMLWITSWITENTTHWGLYINDFWWTAIWAAIVLSIVSWALSLIVGDTQRVTRV